jgi:lipoprotein-releasing system permease protein
VLFNKLIQRYPTLRIAFTHLIGKKRQTLVAMLGVTFGIAVFIFQAGLITGFQSTFIDKIISTTASIHLYSEPEKNRKSFVEQYEPNEHNWVITYSQKPKDKDLKIKNSSFIIHDLESNPEVEGVSPNLGGQVIFRSASIQRAGQVSGINVKREDKIFGLSTYIKEGDMLKLETTANGVILGSGLADNLGVKLNDNVTLISEEGISLVLKVIAIDESGIVQLDNSRAYVKINTAQQLLNKEGDYITDINIKLKNIDKSEELAKEFQSKYNYRAQDWKEANASTFSVFKVQNMVTYLVIISIMVVSGFGIFNIQMMIIYEKMGDIAILKAIGYKDRDIKVIFLSESIVIGILGGLIGLLLGYVVTLIVGSIPLNVKGFVAIKYLVFNRKPIFFIMAFVFGLIATSIAGYLPARKAAKIDPVDIIRGK